MEKITCPNCGVEIIVEEVPFSGSEENTQRFKRFRDQGLEKEIMNAYLTCSPPREYPKEFAR